MTSTADLVTDSVADPTIEDTKDATKPFKSMTNSERWRFMREVITIEPLIALYITTAVLCGPALLTLEYDKACRADAGFNDTVCEAIVQNKPGYGEFEAKLQVRITDMHAWLNPVQNIVPMILILFLGSYSDRHKLRKPFLLLPIFGEFFSVIGCILSVIFMRSWPLAVLGFFQTVLPSFFGGPSLLVMAAFSYIADVSTLEMRTIRITVVSIVLQVFTTVVQYISGPLFQALGYIPMLLLAAVLFLMAFLWGCFWVTEKRAIVEIKKSCIADAFDPRHVIDTFSLLFKKSPGNKRLYILIVMTVLVIMSLVVGGEGSVFFNFSRIVYGWNETNYSYLLGNNALIHLIGTAIAMPIFTKLLRLSDYSIIIIGATDKIIFNIIVVLYQSVTGLYIGVFLSFLTGITGIGIRSLATKVVSVNDLGKAQSLFGICEAIGPAIASPIYNKGIYQQTLDTFISAYWLLGIALYFLCICLITWIYLAQRQASPQKTKETQEKPTNGEINMVSMQENITTHI